MSPLRAAALGLRLLARQAGAGGGGAAAGQQGSRAARNGSRRGGRGPPTSRPVFFFDRGFAAGSAGAGEDLYAVLGVQPGASAAELKAGYRKQALKWHPDRHPEGKARAERQFKKVSEAYSTLSDPAARAAYDAGRRGGASSYSYGSPGGGSSQARAEWERNQRNQGRARRRSPGMGGMSPEEFSRAQADQIFREFFGRGDLNEVLRQFERVAREHARHRAAGRSYGGWRPSDRTYRGMGREEQEEVFGQAFGHSFGREGVQEVVKESFTLGNGQRVVRTTTTIQNADGSVSKRVEEHLERGGAGGRPRAYTTPSEPRSIFQHPVVRTFVAGMLWEAANAVVRALLGAVRRLFLGRR